MMRAQTKSVAAAFRKAAVLTAACLLAVGNPAFGQGSVSTAVAPSPDRYEAAIEAGRGFVETLMREANLPGLQVAVAREGEILWSEGFGSADLEQGVRVTPLTKFRIGSLGKPLTAAAALELHQQGRLDLDAPVRSYVPSFPEKPWAITSRQLLGHLGGIRHYREGEDQIRYRSYGSVVEALEVFEGDSLLHRPGTAYEYSSYGYVLLSAAMAGADDESFLRTMRREVFRPLGMKHTVADHVDSIVPHRAEFYTESDEDGRLLNAPFTNNSYKWAAGGNLSTAEDLVRFGSGLLSGEFLPPALVDTMFTSMVTRDGDTTGYAMGWRPRTDWNGRRVVRHGGSSVGGRAFLMLYPEQELAIAILVNASLAPVFQEEAQSLTHLFLDHPATADRIGVSGDSLAGTYRFTTERDGETVSGKLHLTGDRLHPGWMDWRGAAAPVPLVLVGRHDGRTRLIGAGVHGALNVWVTFRDRSFEGRWDWLGRTSSIEGRRVRP